jgi:hypothetical protein
MKGFRRLRLLAEIVGAVDGVPDERLELAAAAARRALDPTAPCEQDPVGALANLGAAIYAHTPTVVVLGVQMPDGRHFSVALEYTGQVVSVHVAGLDSTPWQAILRALREGMGPKGDPMPTARLDAFRDAVEAWSHQGTCRGGHPEPACKDPACQLAQGPSWGN